VDGVSGLCGRMQRVKKRANTAENRAKISRQSPAKTAKSGQNTVVFGNNAHFTHLSDIVTRQILSENTNTSVKLTPEIDITLAPIGPILGHRPPATADCRLQTSGGWGGGGVGQVGQLRTWGRQNADVLYGQPQASPASVFVGDQSTTHTPLRRRRLIGLDSLHVKE
jgi:hypothetical protein